MKISHTKDGLIVKYKGKTFIIGYLSLLQQNVDLTDNEYIGYAQATLRYHCTVRNVPIHKVENLRPISVKKASDFSPFYKYVEESIFQTYISQGIFQLGTVEQYRTIENNKQRDEFEGHSFLNLNVNKHMVNLICSSGFNYLIFCATKTDNSNIHKDQFGSRILYCEDVKGFAEAICNRIQAKRYFVQNVEYNTLKLYINKEHIINPEIDVNQLLSPAFFELIEDHLLFPSLFVKPDTFKTENEVRIVFEMPMDCTRPYRFEDKELLKFFRL